MGKKKGKKKINKLLQELDSNQDKYTYETVDTILGAEGTKLAPFTIEEQQEVVLISSEEEEEDSLNVSQSTLDNFISFPETNQEAESPKFELKINCIPWRVGNSVPKTLSKDIELFVSWMEARPEEILARDSLVEKITAEIRKVCGKSCEVRIFGSFASGLHLPFSDIDLVVLNSEKQNPINRVGKAFRNVPFVSNLRVIKKAKVPIIKFEDITSGVPVDICFDVMNGVNNTPVIQKNLKTFKNAKPLMVLVKYLLFQKGLNEVYTGGIGSYALFLLVVSFLQHRNPGEDDSLGELFIDFCEFYGRDFNYFFTGISVKHGGSYFSKENRGWTDETRNFLLSIEDPNDEDNDVSRNSYNIMAIRTLFKKVFEILSVKKNPPIMLDSILTFDNELVKKRLHVISTFADKVPKPSSLTESAKPPASPPPIEFPRESKKDDRRASTDNRRRDNRDNNRGRNDRDWDNRNSRGKRDREYDDERRNPKRGKRSSWDDRSYNNNNNGGYNNNNNSNSYNNYNNSNNSKKSRTSVDANWNSAKQSNNNNNSNSNGKKRKWRNSEDVPQSKRSRYR